MFNHHNLPALQLQVCNYRLCLRAHLTINQIVLIEQKLVQKPSHWSDLFSFLFFLKKKILDIRDSTQICCLCEGSGWFWQLTKPILAADEVALSDRLGCGLWATMENTEWQTLTWMKPIISGQYCYIHQCNILVLQTSNWGEWVT